MPPVSARVPAEELAEPKRIKISNKRQITIPASAYEKYGFSEYAYLEETEEGLFITPLDLASEDEQLTEQLLRYLVEKGYEGNALIDKYKEIKPMFFSYHTALAQAEQDYAEGRFRPVSEFQEELKRKYGL